MSTLYPGFNPFTFTLQPATFGRFVTGAAADDGDLDDAAILMSLPMADTDNTQFLAWRCIDIVSGGFYTYTPLITIKNAFTFTGHVIHSGTSSALYMRAPDMRIDSGKTLLVGHSATGAGHILVDGAGAGSDIVAQGGANITVDGGGGLLNVQNNALFRVESDANARFENFPNISTTPLSDGALSSSNIIKAIACFEMLGDGAGGIATISTGYNINGLAISGGGVRITFARNMRSSKYSVTGTITKGDGSKVYIIGAVSKTIGACTILAGITNTTFVPLNTTNEVIVFTVEFTDPSNVP